MSAQNEDFRSRRTVQINYDEFASDEDKCADSTTLRDGRCSKCESPKFVHEGRYVPDDMLPFNVDESAGTWFTMDGTRCELLGDLGGHAVYRREQSKSTIRTMGWDDFVTAYERGRIQL